MILIDVGNTNIVFALSNNNKIKNISRIYTNKETNILVKNVKKIILTGGLAKIFKNDIKPKPIVNSNLTLEGLQVIGSLYYVKNKH